MNIFQRVWQSLVSFVQHFFGTQAPAVTAWLSQFLTDEGQIVLADAEKYGPQIFNGTITIVQAAEALGQDLLAKGISDIENLGETIYNALRTQVNFVASATPASSPATATVPLTPAPAPVVSAVVQPDSAPNISTPIDPIAAPVNAEPLPDNVAQVTTTPHD